MHLKYYQFDWHLPNPVEVQTAQELLDEFLGDTLDELEQLCQQKKDLRKKQLEQRLVIISFLVDSVSYALPFWPANGENSPIQLTDSMTDIDQPLQFSCKPDYLHHLDISLRGRNARLAVLETLYNLQTFLTKHREDATESMNWVIRLYNTILHHGGIHSWEVGGTCNDWVKNLKDLTENKVVGIRSLPAMLLEDLVEQLHDERMVARKCTPFTGTHDKVLKNLHALSISQYSHVR